jgi:KipI family sensor histidine kinase inhibitor
MEVRRVGAAGLMLAVDDPIVWHTALVARRAAGELAAIEIVPGARTVLLDGVTDVDRVVAALPGWEPPADRAAAAGELVEIPVGYDGEDLPFVADHWGVSVDAAVERVASAELTVAFCGFSPGFAYLTGLPGSMPRLESPRPRVPAGSVGLAGEYAGIYPTASPGGWRLIGRTGVTLFDVTRDPPALLVPGTRVRLVRA